MSRKNRDNEQSFGSDAFLDVIANIVGILIILIVVAGVKVSRAPLITAPLNVPDVEGPTIELDIPTIVIEAAPMFAESGSVRRLAERVSPGACSRSGRGTGSDPSSSARGASPRGTC